MEEVFIVDEDDPLKVRKQLDDALKDISDIQAGKKDQGDHAVR